MANNPAGGMSPFDVDFSKVFANFNWPAAPDVSAIGKIFQKNMEAIAAANKTALEGAQKFAQRNTEIMQQAMADINATMQALASGGASAVRTTKHADALRQTYEHALNNLKELGKIIQQSNAEAMQVLTKRYTEVMDEILAIGKQSK